MLQDGVPQGVSQCANIVAQWCVFFGALFLFRHGRREVLYWILYTKSALKVVLSISIFCSPINVDPGKRFGKISAASFPNKDFKALSYGWD